MSVYDKIKSHIDNIKVIDTHEHIMPEASRLDRKLDFGTLMADSYLIDCMIAAGQSNADASFVYNGGNDIDEKWKRTLPYFNYIKNYDAVRAFNLSISKIYGVDSLNENTYQLLSQRMNEKNKPGFTERLIREANVDLCINSTLEGQNEGRLLVQDSAVKCFKPVLFMAGLFVPNYGNIKSIEEITGLKIKNLDGLLAAADWYIEKYAKSSACIKFNLAYARKIYFPEVEKNEAEKAFADFLSDTKNTASEKIELYQNFLIHYIIEKAAAEDLPIQFHTGLTTVNRTMLENVDPKLLCNLFLKYPQAKFVLLHIGYPFYQEAITLAKLFSNVYLDMAWIWIVDSISSKDFLKKYLATAAVNKLFAFGGDFVSPDLIFGHLELARIGISEVLAELVEAKRIDIDRAKFIADRILRENAVEFYNSKQTGIQ